MLSKMQQSYYRKQRTGKYQVTTSPKKEDDTDSDKKGPLPWNNYLGGTRMRTHHEDKRKNQVTTIAGKEDDTAP